MQGSKDRSADLPIGSLNATIELDKEPLPNTNKSNRIIREIPAHTETRLLQTSLFRKLLDRLTKSLVYRLPIVDR